MEINLALFALGFALGLAVGFGVREAMSRYRRARARRRRGYPEV